MKPHLLSFFSLLFITLGYPVVGQVDSTRLWREGPLQWSDFQGDGAFQEQNVLSVITWKEGVKKEKVGYIRYYYPDIHAEFHPFWSFVKEGFATDEELQRQQYRFDIEEYYARAFRDSLLHGVSSISETRTLYYQRAAEAIEKETLEHTVLKETLAGEDLDPKSLKWSGGGGSFFDVNYSIRFFPVMADKYVRFTNNLGLSVGFLKKRFILAFDLNLLSADEMLGHYYRYPYTDYRSQGAYLGYAFYQTERWSISALIGGGCGRYFMVRDKDPARIFDKTYESGFIQEGLLVDYTLSSFISLHRKNPERTDIRVFARLYSDQMIIHDGVIPAVGLNGGFRIITRNLR